MKFSANTPLQENDVILLIEKAKLRDARVGKTYMAKEQIIAQYGSYTQFLDNLGPWGFQVVNDEVRVVNEGSTITLYFCDIRVAPLSGFHLGFDSEAQIEIPD